MRALAGWALCLGLASPAAAGPLSGSQQIVLVVSPSWGSVTAKAQRYERAGGPWRKIGAPFPVTLGRGGLGWRSDPGAPPPPQGAPVKAEGDGRSPAGVMPIGDLWGHGDAAPQGAGLPYHRSGDRDRCVDDPASPSYGKLAVEPEGGPPWRSAEHLRGDGGPGDVYRYLIVVGYNMGQAPRPRAGSCIFLHLWRGPEGPTAGCTAMAEADLLSLSRWLRPAARPMLVQLPAVLLPALRKDWDLPPDF